MSFKEGRNKTGGRKAGVSNKDSEFKAFIKELLDSDTDKISEELGKLTGKPYLDTILSFCEYAVPKLARVEVKDESETTQNITINYTKQK